MTTNMTEELDAAEQRRIRRERLLYIRDICIVVILGSWVTALVYYIATR